MNYAIIAAGEGSRLKEEGFSSVKPLVKVNGEYLIERLIRIFKANYAQEITIIINQKSKELQRLLNSKRYGVKINLIVKSTPSSLHSFNEIINHSSFEECCLTTVDTIFNEKEFHRYITYFQEHKYLDALMGTTEYVDDEKPLYIEKIDNLITNFVDNKTEKSSCVSSGIYCFRKTAILLANKAIEENVSRMRNYQRMLIEEGLNVESYLMGKVIDIDHVADIDKAEELIRSNNKHILSITRFAEYSPNSQNKDLRIMIEVLKNLRKRGFDVDIKNEKNVDFSNAYYPYIITMARNPRVVECLAACEKEGAIVVNSTLSCKNCYRERQLELFQRNQVLIPQSQVLDTQSFVLEDLYKYQEGNFWLKRADFQTIEEIDVIKIDTYLQAEKVLKNYNVRGIKKAIICQHIEGDVIKFYGVRDTDFFYYYYPEEDKFHNKINTSKDRNNFSLQDMKQQTIKAAQILDLDVYGGDIIVDKQGNAYIIDMNDFPSFSCCTKAAAKAISEQFIKKCNL